MLRILLSSVALAFPQDTTVLTLEDATARALTVSPVVAAAEGAVNAPRGERSEVWWPFPDNPTLEYGRARRRVGGWEAFDWEWAVRQEIDLSGQWAVRGSAAGKMVQAAEERTRDARRVVDRVARLAYLELAIAERRAALLDSTATFADRLAAYAREQLDAGEINRLEYNTAILEAARQRSAAERSKADLAAVSANLARLLALGSDSIPRTAPLPDIPLIATDDGAAILALARSRRPDLAAAILESEAAGKYVTAARLGAIPQFEVSAFKGQEAGTDDLLGFSVGVKVPLFHFQQTNTGTALADRSAAQAELEAVEREVLADVQAAIGRHARTRNAERRFAIDVLGAAVENVMLTEIALTTGEVDLTQVVVLRTIAVAARLEYLDVFGDAYAAWFDLAAAVAVSPAELSELMIQEDQ